MRVNRPFADCDIAELHLADAVQPFGAVVVIDGDGVVCAASANTEAFLGEPPQRLLGSAARETLPATLDPADLWDETREGADATPLRLHLRTVRLGERPVTLAAHQRDGKLLLELQQAGEGDVSEAQAAAVVQRATDKLERADELDAAASVLLDAIAELTGYGRAMLYRFLPGWHGEVIDERLARGYEGYLGLRFPAGDIPPNARRLYLHKRQRIIADVNYEPVPLLGAFADLSLDLSGSELRAVHPTHLEYLRNMGVAASFSVSVVARGRLWGMVACHHDSPKRLGFVTRQACELVAAVVSLPIANLERDDHLRQVEKHRLELARAWFDVEGSAGSQVATLLPELRRTLGADGALLRLGDREHTDGDVPSGAALTRLQTHLAELPTDDVTASSEVPAAMADDAEAVRTASGVLHLPLGEDAYLTLLRAEEAETVSWAGQPPESKRGTTGPLGPRTSFAIWRSTTRGQAKRWRDAEIESAGEIRTRLLDRQERAELSRRAHTDALTGLANRSAFDATLQDVLSARKGQRLALLMVDLDRFKEVNDRHGHVVGDKLLQLVAQRLHRIFREGDVIARLGGDEFAVILPGAAHAMQVSASAARVVRSLGRPYDVDGVALEVGTSVGAAFAAGPDDLPSAFVDRADQALYAAKRAGRNRFVLVGGEDDPSS